MENRNLDKLLSDKVKSISEIEESAKLVSSEISEKLSLEFAHRKLVTSIHYDKRKLEFSCLVSESSYANLTIDENSINIGLHISIVKSHPSIEIDSKFNAIKERYFNPISIAKKRDGTHIIQSEFTIRRQALKGREFVDYATFVMDKAILLAKELESNNLISQRDQAA